MPQLAPAFIITIDTEGDNLWAKPERVTTENVKFLPRFQQLCEKYGLKPTYLTNYEMAINSRFIEFGRDVINRNKGEIGMHLHAWDSPPVSPKDPKGQAYLIEYSSQIMREKIGFMTNLLEEKFQRKMTSHRAGRWGLDKRYAQLLVEHGYLVDCSVSPFVSWKKDLGEPNGMGGTDYSKFPSMPYLMDLNHIHKAGDSPLLEVPVSILTRHQILHQWVRHWPYLLKKMSQKYFPLKWLRPDGSNLRSMQWIVQTALEEKWPCIEFVLHSSELMPGGSPYFQTVAEIKTIYEHLETLFSEASVHFEGTTLTEFYHNWMNGGVIQ